MPRDDVMRLRHMAEVAEPALRFCQGHTRVDLDTDDMLRTRAERAAEALAYNGLVRSWPKISRYAHAVGQSNETQTTMFDN